MIILGLDVSTSCTGVCFLDTDRSFDDKQKYILLLDALTFKGCKTLWEKADSLQRWAQAWVGHVDRIVLEEPLMGFRPGMSSAQTITQLMRFNGVVSYIVRNVFKQEPEYIQSAHARKLCGMKLQRTSIGGPQKHQVFAHMCANDLKHVSWPLKKNGKIVDWAMDACDAYVIARAASLKTMPDV